MDISPWRDASQETEAFPAGTVACLTSAPTGAPHAWGRIVPHRQQHSPAPIFLLPTMTTLRRGPDTFHLPPSLWEALQQFAIQEGWKPAGMVDVRSDRVYSGYTRSRVVGKCDARRPAA